MNNKNIWIIGAIVVLIIAGYIALRSSKSVSDISSSDISDVDIIIDRSQFSFNKQEVGEPVDGYALKSIRHADHNNFYRFVFDVISQTGSSVDRIPASGASYRFDNKTIILALNGFRRDFTPNRPLKSEGGEIIGKLTTVEDDVVSGYYKNLVLDDSSIGYSIALRKDAKFHLFALEDPVRIVLDIEK